MIGSYVVAAVWNGVVSIKLSGGIMVKFYGVSIFSVFIVFFRCRSTAIRFVFIFLIKRAGLYAGRAVVCCCFCCRCCSVIVT